MNVVYYETNSTVGFCNIVNQPREASKVRFVLNSVSDHNTVFELEERHSFVNVLTEYSAEKGVSVSLSLSML